MPFREEDLWNGYPEETNAPYGLAKKMLLVQSQAYRDQYGINTIFLLPINLYGPRDHFDPAPPRHPGADPQVRGGPTTGRSEVVAWGDGSPTREFLYVDDAAEGLVLAAERYDGSEPVNLGSGCEISIRELTEQIAGGGFPGRISWDTSKPNGQPRRKLDTSRAREAFGFESQTDFDAGLARPWPGTGTSARMARHEAGSTTAALDFQRYTARRVGHWDRVAGGLDRFDRANHAYHARLREVYASIVPPGQRVLEIGCGAATCWPRCSRRGVGVDFSPEMIERRNSRASRRLHFTRGRCPRPVGSTGRSTSSSSPTCVNDLWDVQTVLEQVRARLHAGDAHHPQLLQPALGAAAAAGRRRWAWPGRRSTQNWLTRRGRREPARPGRLRGPVTRLAEMLWPLAVPGCVEPCCNRYLVEALAVPRASP